MCPVPDLKSYSVTIRFYRCLFSQILSWGSVSRHLNGAELWGIVHWTTFPKAPPPSPQPQLIGQEAGPGPGEAIYWQLSGACQILPGEFEQGGVSLLGRVSQWFSEEQRKEAERKKKETDNWEKQRWEKQKFPQKDIGSESPWCGLPTWFPSRQGCWESPDFGASEMNPAKKHKRTYTHVHIPHVHSFLLFLCSPLPHLNNFQNGKSQRRLSLLSGCKSWETEMNRSGQQNFWRGQREEVADCRRENTGAQISWGISQSVCTVVWDLNSKTSLKSPHLPSQFCSLPCQLHSYRFCPPRLARQWLQQLLEPQQPLITANRCLGLGSPRNRPWDKDLNMSGLLGSDHRKQW